MRSTKDLVDIVQDVRSRSKQGSRLRSNNRVKILPSHSSKQDIERKTVSRAASLLSRDSENQNYETVPTQQDVAYATAPGPLKEGMFKSTSSLNKTIDRSSNAELSTLKKLRKLEVLSATDKETIEV